MSKTIRLTNSFPARDANGKLYMIDEFTEFISYMNSKGSGEMPGFKSLQCRGAGYVNYISKGHYKIVASDIELTSDDPSAV
jgi:hypothetical protein